MIKTNYEIIRAIVERMSGNKKMVTQSKGRDTSNVRYVYYQLCKDYYGDSYNHRKAAKVLNSPHSQSNYALKMFVKLKGQSYFNHYIELYNDCYYDLLELEVKINSVIIEHKKATPCRINGISLRELETN
jgi:hypothetical protein